jgi:N-acetyl-1-D-myo-inositol-2-amino-2-deoxy-alpha-D-glucopyranoside deacetylase
VSTPTLLFVHPHPDDESIACGGVIARYGSEGVRTVVVTCTGGEVGENLAGIELGALTLVEHRRRELDEAVRILGVSRHERLGFRDSGMIDTADNEHPDCFHQAPLDVAAAPLAVLIREERPEAIVSDDERGSYGHPDHIKAHWATIRAVELAADPSADIAGEPWQVPRRFVHTFSHSRLHAAHAALVEAGLPSPFAVEGEEDATDRPKRLGAPDEVVTTRIDITQQLATKLAAMRAHASQMSPDSFFFNVPEQVVGQFLGVEEFVLEAGSPTDSTASSLR